MEEKLQNLYNIFKNRYENFSNIIATILNKMEDKILLSEYEYNSIQTFIIELKNAQDDLFKELSDKLEMIFNLNDIENIINQSSFNNLKEQLIEQLDLLESATLQDYIDSFKTYILMLDPSERNLEIIKIHLNLINNAFENDCDMIQLQSIIGDVSLVNSQLFMGIVLKHIIMKDKNILLESDANVNGKEDIVIEEDMDKNIVDEESIEDKTLVIIDSPIDFANDTNNNSQTIEILEKDSLCISSDANISDNHTNTCDTFNETIINNEDIYDYDKYQINAKELLIKKGFNFLSTSIDEAKEIKKDKKNFNKSSFAKSIPTVLSSSYARILEKIYLRSYILESEVELKNDLVVLRSLFNEGYLAKYTIENSDSIYFLTKIGSEIYSVSQVRSLIRRVTKTSICDNDFNYKDYYNKDREKLEADYVDYKLITKLSSMGQQEFYNCINPFHTIISKNNQTTILYIVLSNSNYTYGDFNVLKLTDSIDKVVCIIQDEEDKNIIINLFKEFFDCDVYYAIYDDLNTFIIDGCKHTLEELYNLAEKDTESITFKEVTKDDDHEIEEVKESAEVVSNIDLLEENKQELIESLIIKTPSKEVKDIDFQQSTSKDIALYIKEYNINSFKVMKMLITKLLEENKLFTAFELLNSLSKENTEYTDLYNYMKCALGKTTQTYDSNMLKKYFSCVYDNTTDLNNSCFIATMLRILFCPTNLYDYDFKNWYDQFNNLDTDLQYFNKIKKIASILYNVITKIDKRGFSASNLRQFKINEGLNNELSAIIERANEIKKHKTKFTFPDKGLFVYSLGEKSTIFTCIKYICENDISKLTDVKNIYSNFVTDNIIDEDLVKKYISDSNSKIHNARALTDLNEKEVIREIKHRLKVIDEWISFNSNNEIINNKDLKLEKVKLFAAIDEYKEEVSSCAENNIIKYVLDNIIDQFGDNIHTHLDIKEFVLSDYIVLDENLSICEKELPHYSLTSRLLDHIIVNSDMIVDPKTITYKLEYNLNDNENLGFVYSVKSYFERNKMKIEFDFSEIDNYRDSYEKQIKDGFDELINSINLDSMYGRITDDDSQDLYSDIDKAKIFFDNTFNLGLFKIYKKILENYKNKLMVAIHNGYCERLLSLIVDKSLDEYTIINEIYNVIKQNNYTVAEEYMFLLENGHKSLNKDLTTSEDFFREFNKIYDTLYDLLENPNVKGKNIKGNEYLLSRLTKIAQTELNIEKRRKSTTQANNLLNCWINSPEQFESKNDLLKNLFQELQFDVEDISFIKNKKEYRYKDVKLRQVGKQLSDYLHPISDFGTNIQDNIPVVYLDGNFKAKEINNYITKDFKYNGFTIVLLNGYLSKIERNKLAHEFKTSGLLLHKYIVIDRILFTFLAMIEKSERQKAFVNCTLPYSYVQPFVESGGGRIPDEMFYGRVQELHSIMDIDKGAILVYGGRQLGKTALLQRVQNLMMKHEEKSYTIYLSIQNIKSSKELLKALLSELLLLNNKFNKTIILSETKAKKVDNWSDFAELIRIAFNRDDFRKLYILFDEVDKFIQEQENEGYNVINELIKLKDDSSLHGKFKFVLAGLHNVVKCVHKDNDSLRKLGAPLCVKPLPTADAKRFITEPLSTIGYKFSNEENQISMILSKLNYYPGLLHIFCSRIIKDSNANFRQYYNNVEKVPPYLIDEKTLGKFLSNNEINEAVKNRLDMTLDLNGSLYLKIACAISYLYEYDNKQQGVSVSDLKDFFTSKPSDDKVVSLLEEMIELGILRKATNDNNLYVYRKHSFHKSVLELKSNLDELFETAITDYDI